MLITRPSAVTETVGWRELIISPQFDESGDGLSQTGPLGAVAFPLIFKELVEQQASDLYLKSGTKPAIRGLGPVVAAMPTGLSVDVAAMTRAVDHDLLALVINRIDDAIAPDAKSVNILRTCKLDGLMRTGIHGQAFDGFLDCGLNVGGQSAEFARGGRDIRNTIRETGSSWWDGGRRPLESSGPADAPSRRLHRQGLPGVQPAGETHARAVESPCGVPEYRRCIGCAISP
jgi:hypothetical protein